MADPAATRRYLQTMGALGRARRPIELDEVVIDAPRRPAGRGGIEIDDVMIGSARREAPGLPPVPNETVVDEIEVIGTPPRLDPVAERVGSMLAPRPAPPAEEEEPEVIGARPRVDLSQGEWMDNIRARSSADRRVQEGAEHRRMLERDDADRYERELGAAYDRSFLEGLEMDNRVNAMGEGVVQGLTLGFGDELGAAGRVLTGAADDYELERDRLRGNIDIARREAPGAYGTAEFIGGMAPAMAVPGAGPGASLTRRVLTSTLGGAGFGGLSGVGHSTADRWQDVAREGVDEALIGGITGGGMELGMSGLRSARDRFRTAPEGTPRPGDDFTPEQWAEAERRMDAGDPDLFDAMTTRSGLEDSAATRRVRSTADSASLADVRRAGDYHGPGGEGYRGLARDLDETGISPRRSLTTARTAQERAARLENQAGRELGAVRERMDDAARGADDRILANADDELEVLGRRPPRVPEPELPPSPLVDREALDAIDAATTPEWRASLDPETRRTLDTLDRAFARGNSRAQDNVSTGAARRGRRPEGVSLRDREGASVIDAAPAERPPRSIEPGYEPVPVDEAAREVHRAADPALVRYSGTLTTLDEAGRARQTPGGSTADRLRAEADQALARATTREQRASAMQLRELADDVARLEPETYSQAQGRLRALDEEAAYGTRYPNATGASPERTNRARSTRQGVREDMDLAVERTLGPEAVREAQAARGRYGTARAVGVLSERGAEREAANLQAGLGDTIAIQNALGQNAPALTRITNAIEGVVVNRYLRGSGHAIIATAQEMQSDAMARAIVRRLGEQPVTEPLARMLAEAQRRGPRAFGNAMLMALRDQPEAAAVIEPVVRAFNEDGSPNWDVVPGVQYAGEEDESDVGADIDWSSVPGVQYADEYEEEQRR